MELHLNSLNVDCVIGERPEERERTQRLVLDVKLVVSDKASASDSLGDAADYAALSQEITAALVAAKCELIERAASIACDVALKDKAVESVEVTVTKSGAIAGLDSASAVCKRSRGLVEYELAGIETIARGVCIADGKLLLCKAKGGKSTYLPGGHIEFGESGRVALEREIREELALESHTGRFLGAVENSFLQHGKPHAEINLVYQLELNRNPDGSLPAIRSNEDWIEFVWCPLSELAAANLLPEVFRRLGDNPTAVFEV